MKNNANDNLNYWRVRDKRSIQDEQGVTHLVELERQYWAAFDFLAEESHLTGPQIIARAKQEAGRQGVDFGEYLSNYIAWLDSAYRDQPGLWNRNQNKPDIVGYIGPASQLRIDELESQRPSGEDA